MNNTKTFTHTALVTLAALSLGLSLGSVAEAKPVLVERGSHGGHIIVDSERIPTGARPLPAANLPGQKPSKAQNKTPSQKQAAKLITRGPNGATFIVN